MKRLPVVTSVLLSTLLVVSACKQNPFPEAGRITQREPQKPPPVVPPLVLDVPDSTEVIEGQAVEVQITASVPAPGKPLVAIQGLPEGATFDPETLKITWTPGFNAANDPRDPGVIVKMYPLKLQLSSSEDPVTITSRASTIIVRDFFRPMKLSLPADPINLKEGVAHEQVIDVASEDYPKGPFEVQVKNLPMGASIIRDLTNPARFKITYTPSFREVSLNDPSVFSNYAEKKLEVSVFGPRGSSVTTPLTWRVFDVREKALVLSPTSVTQGTSVSFTISAQDPNGEEPPSLSMSPRPRFGLADLKTESTSPGNPARGINPSIVSSFRWTQIPPDKIGTTETINFKACVKQTRWSKTFCVDQPVKVTFELDTHKPPLVDRSAFPLGSIRYVREQEKITIPVTVRDGEFATTPPTVTLTPPGDEIKWSLGKLEIEGKKAGIKQFTLNATSVFGVVHTESFLLEVLPWSWSSVVVFGESPTDPEVKGTVAHFESAQIANPVLQLNDPRLLVLRKSVYLTTTAFNEPSMIAPMEKAASQVGDIVLSTPLLEKLEAELKTEIADSKVILGPRVADLAGYSLEVDPAGGLTPPTNPIKLLGKVTAESAKPLKVKYDGIGTACKTILVLKKAGEDDVPVMLTCKRKGGGNLIVGGIELADIQTSPTDNRLIKKWLTNLVAQ